MAIVTPSISTELRRGAQLYGTVTAFDGERILLVLEHRLMYVRGRDRESTDIVTLQCLRRGTCAFLLAGEVAMRVTDAAAFVDVPAATWLADATLSVGLPRFRAVDHPSSSGGFGARRDVTRRVLSAINDSTAVQRMILACMRLNYTPSNENSARTPLWSAVTTQRERA